MLQQQINESKGSQKVLLFGKKEKQRNELKGQIKI